jgi:hypothetical protein
MRNGIGDISVNILRICLVLIFIGLFLPVGCKSNGFQIAEGILGNSKIAKEAIFLAPVDDIYGYLLLGVFAFALVGFIASFFSNSFYASFVFFTASLIFVIVILYHFKIYFNFNDLSFYIKIIFPLKLKLLLAGYGMVIGFVGGILAFIVKMGTR